LDFIWFLKEMFNFAVAGSLERYQPIQREPSVRPVDQVSPADQTGSIWAGTEGEKFELPEQGRQASTTRFVPARGYSSDASARKPLQRKRAWIVADLMTKSVQTLRGDDTVSMAKSFLEGTGFRHIPIVNVFKRIDGLISDRDLLRTSKDQIDERSVPISAIMTKRMLTCFPETPLRLAAHTMLEEGFSSLPVVDLDGFLLGILTTGDILKAIVNEAPLEIWA
jgi:CBS domain-containing membrane protein